MEYVHPSFSSSNQNSHLWPHGTCVHTCICMQGEQIMMGDIILCMHLREVHDSTSLYIIYVVLMIRRQWNCCAEEHYCDIYCMVIDGYTSVSLPLKYILYSLNSMKSIVHTVIWNDIVNITEDNHPHACKWLRACVFWPCMHMILVHSHSSCFY